VQNDDDVGIVMENAVGGDDFRYTVLTPEQLTHDLMDTIGQVQNIVQLKPTQCRVMLAHFKWNKDRMLEA
jgi:hypothetical protein